MGLFDQISPTSTRPAPTTGSPTSAGGAFFGAPSRPLRQPQVQLQGIISRTEFIDYVRARYGVRSVHVGTQAEQEAQLTRNFTGHSVQPTLTGWQTWDPGDPSDAYSDIIAGIEDFSRQVGGIPRLDSIWFFYQDYEVSPTGVATAAPGVGAAYSAGQLSIYRHVTQTTAMPNARSVAGATYPPVGLSVSNPGSSPGAPIPYMNPSASIRRNISHELGHGLGEAAHTLDPHIFDQYAEAAGWYQGVLYDAGAPAVQTALQNHQPLPSQYIITVDHWNDPRWVEQPMSDYTVSGGLSEDFAEAVAAFVYHPGVLQARSPRRYTFLLNNILSWNRALTALPTMHPMGDFNLPTGDTRVV